MKIWFKRPLVGKPLAVDAFESGEDGAVDDLISAGQKLEDDGHPDEALARYLEAIELNSRSAKAYLNAGNAYRLLQNASASVGMYQRSIQLDPTSAGAQINLGTALLEDGKSGLAEVAYRAALKLRPQWPDAWVGLGCALEERSAVQDAIAAYTHALGIQPDHVGAVTNLSNLQIHAMDMTGARSTLQEFLRHAPDNRSMLQQLGLVEESSGRLEESLAIQRALVAQKPGDFKTWSRMLFHSGYLPDRNADENLTEHCRFGRMLESQVVARTLIPPRRSDSERRLKIGYVSGDFHVHPVANFVHPILRWHDRERFAIFCYHTKDNADELTAKLKGLTDFWRNVVVLDDDSLADAIQRDQIDILVDLSGHTDGNRLAVFARKPAALQFTWLGYLGTTGLSRMDYRLCDAHTDPIGVAEGWQTEVPARMPDSQWCYDPQVAVAHIPTALPRLRRGYWTFGSFNNYRKLNGRVFAAWAAVLKAIPGSRLRLFSFENAESGERALAAIAGHGIERNRVDWVLRTSPQGHFDSFAEIDVALDSFPYNGATTTCDALLMGVPVLVVTGERSLSRGGVSLLSTLDMSQWIAESEQQLPATAQRQLASVEAIVRLRSELPQRMRASALMDAPQFTRNLELQYRSAWRRLCGAADDP